MESSPTVRGTIIKVPDSSPGLLFANGEQKYFKLEGIWKSPVAPAANMIVDVQLDGSGAIQGIAAVDAQQAARERMNQIGGAAQDQGKQVAEMARLGMGALAMRMGKVALGAAVAVWLAWFFMPAATLELGFPGSKSFTFWELLGVDLSDPTTMVGAKHGVVSLLGLVAIAAPFVAPFLRHAKANLLNALPLLYIVFSALLFRWNVARSVGDAGEMGQELVKTVMDSISIGVGAYVLIAAALVLAAHSFKRSATA